MSEVASTLLKVQLSEYIPEAEPAVPDSDGGKGSNPGAGDQGFNTILKTDADNSAVTTTNNAALVAFFGLAFFILTFIILSIIKKRKNPYAIEGKTPRLTKLQVLSATSASVFLAMVFNSAIFSTPYVGPVNITVSPKLTIDANIIGTDNIAYVKDTITVPASEYGYKLYITTDDSNDYYLRGDSTEGIINPVPTEGPLTDNTYGFSFEDPTLSTTTFYPVKEKSSRTSFRTIAPEETTEPISIWYGVRSKNAEESVYRTKIEYEVISRQPLEEMTAEICASLDVGIVDYEFVDSLGETHFVSKLEDGNCWTKPVQPEDPEDPGTQPALACPTNWHEANDENYTSLDIFYPDTTTEQINDLKESGCVADFATATVTFDANGVEVSNLPDPMHIPNDEVTITDFIYTITTPPALETDAANQHFLGWSLLPDDTTPLYGASSPATLSSPNVTLYAIWSNTRTPKAILDNKGLLNFVYDYYTVEDVNNPATGYKAAYEAEHNSEITNVYLVPDNAKKASQIPWYTESYDTIDGSAYGWGTTVKVPGNSNPSVTTANFEPSFKDFKPRSTKYWFASLQNLTRITNIGNLDTSETYDMEFMFYNTSSLSELELPRNFGYEATDMDGMFAGCRPGGSMACLSGIPYRSVSITGGLNLPEGFGHNVTYLGFTFSSTPLTSISLPSGFGHKATDIRSTFYNSLSLTSLSIPNDTANPENNFGYKADNLENAFSQLRSLTSLELPVGFGHSAWDTDSMFLSDISLTSLSIPNDTANPENNFGYAATIMQSMFSSTFDLTSLELPVGFGHSATNMSWMFHGTSALTSLSIPNDTANPENNFGYKAQKMQNMFAGSYLTSLELPVGFGVNATNTREMFMNTSILQYIYVADDVDWNTENITDSTDMFRGATSLIGEDGITYSSSNTTIANAHVGYINSVPGYFTRACMKDNSCPSTSSGQSSSNTNTNSYNPLSINNIPDTQEPDQEPTQEPAAQPQTPSSTPEGPAPLGVITASKIDNSAAILFAIAMACLFSGTTMLILIIEKVKRDYREENEQF